MRMRAFLFSCVVLLPLIGGCVERTLSVTTDPPGMLVYLNDQEVGRTPLQHDFIWYGTYDLILRKEGYRSIKTTVPIIAPFYEWVPLDLVAELQPATLTDNHNLFFKLEPETAESSDPAPLMERAEDLRGKLTSSRFTRKPTTRP